MHMLTALHTPQEKVGPCPQPLQTWRDAGCKCAAQFGCSLLQVPCSLGLALTGRQPYITFRSKLNLLQYLQVTLHPRSCLTVRTVMLLLARPKAAAGHWGGSATASTIACWLATGSLK